MSLIDRLGVDFDDSTRIKGQNYFHRGAVDITRLTHRSIGAAVQGDRRYIVEIDFDGGYYDYECSCEQYQIRGEPCKHIWATLLESNRRGRLPIEEGDQQPAQNGGQKPPTWKTRLASLKQRMAVRQTAQPEPWPSDRELVYIVDVP